MGVRRATLRRGFRRHRLAHAPLLHSEVAGLNPAGDSVASKVQRRLAAIVSADVARYSRLMEADEVATLATLTARRQELIDPKVAEHSGRVVGTAGDSLLIEFASIVDAVECAIEVQQGLRQRNAHLPEPQQMLFRVGIHVGDVIVDGEEIQGDGVNIAARLQALADPGGVLLSGDAFRQIEKKLDVRCEDLGERELKNISRPVRIYRLHVVEDIVREAATTDPQLPDKPSIAVLPFHNASSDPEQEHFADAITEDITTELSRYRDLFVIASHSAFAFKGKTGDVTQTARELGVRYVLEGSVRRAGDRVRVGAQLIEAAKGGHIWADRYDGSLEEIFDLQDEVASRTAGAVGSGILSAEIESANRRRPENLNAYGLYAQGMGFMVTPSRRGVVKAKEAFSNALALDPTYSNAHVGLGWMYFIEHVFRWGDDPAQSQEKALQALRLAVELDPYNDRAHAILGMCLVFRKEHELAKTEAERALELNPNLALGRLSRSFVNVYSGRPTEGVADARMAIRLSPRDPLMFAFENFVAWGSYLARDYVTAAEWASRMTAKYPDYIFGHFDLAIACAQVGQTERASQALKEAQRITPDLVETAKGQPLKDAEDMEHMWDGLRKAELDC